MLSDDTKTLLDGLLVPDASRGGTALTWLRRAAVSNTPKAILRNIEKLEFLKGAGVARWSLDGLSPNRLKRLAQIARRATGQALQRMPEERRYPLLVAFLHQSLVDVADETIDQFDRCLAEAYARAGHDLEEFRGSVAQTTNETVRLFGELARVVLDPTVRDAQLRHAIYRRIPPNGSGKPSRNPPGSSAPTTTAASTSSESGTATSAGSSRRSSRRSRSGRTRTPTRSWRPSTCSGGSSERRAAACPGAPPSISSRRSGGPT